MLQQTQVSRVIPKYKSFLKAFPNWDVLARTPFRKVLKEWQGLGYNRRALALHRIAKIIIEKYRGKLPQTIEQLIELPSIGPNTAASICAFAFNLPAIFIETNIRTVFIHYFFKNHRKVHDDKIRALVEKTLDKKRPREWYYALMDLGTAIKHTHGNPNVQSAHYRKQSPFKGSNRELRSLILKTISAQPAGISQNQIIRKIQKPQKNIFANLVMLQKEGFISKNSKNQYRLR